MLALPGEHGSGRICGLEIRAKRGFEIVTKGGACFLPKRGARMSPNWHENPCRVNRMIHIEYFAQIVSIFFGNAIMCVDLPNRDVGFEMLIICDLEKLPYVD